MVGYQEILVLVLIAVVFFGPNKLPELARAMGKATTEYKKGMKEAKQSIFQDETDNFSSEDRQIIKAAKDLGIPTEGRSIEEIASDIVNS